MFPDSSGEGIPVFFHIRVMQNAVPKAFRMLNPTAYLVVLATSGGFGGIGIDGRRRHR
jgi:hypothetical protein